MYIYAAAPHGPRNRKFRAPVFVKIRRACLDAFYYQSTTKRCAHSAPFGIERDGKIDDNVQPFSRVLVRGTWESDLLLSLPSPLRWIPQRSLRWYRLIQVGTRFQVSERTCDLVRRYSCSQNREHFRNSSNEPENTLWSARRVLLLGTRSVTGGILM